MGLNLLVVTLSRLCFAGLVSFVIPKKKKKIVTFFMALYLRLVIYTEVMFANIGNGYIIKESEYK